MNPFDWQRMLLHEFPLGFLGEVMLRSLFAFIVVFAFLRFSGRRGVRQISLFEVLVILTLGSAAGDVSFYEDVPLLPILAVFVTLLCLYRLTTYAMERNARFGAWMEGKPVVIIKDGLYDTEALGRKNIASDEFFMELRRQNVEHLGQVRLGILEVNGDVSLYYFDESETRPGLSVLPPCLRRDHAQIPSDGLYSCNHCGMTSLQRAGEKPSCQHCNNDTWSKSIGRKRLTSATRP
ncbi:DUF421 domain-containing protein [Metapseudomonas resinovorans]|uniref:DUF421 domain-containing protein n=1 Tax=Metapseudomonas resinovorans TaxID=53412 RepID=UPI000987211E|nr:DUF421 domain-containing protein [Pseudomonas resinovorans]GLZ87532.1 DUF421 domain-containing protein [Pseudomonas resinovorans]